MKKLLSNVSVDTDGQGFVTDGGSKNLFIFADNFGGGSVTIYASADGGDHWIPLEIGGVPAVFTDQVVKVIDYIAQGMLIKAELSGSSGASGVNAWLT